MKCKYILQVFLFLLAAQTVKAQPSDLQIDILNNFNFGKVAVTGWSGSVSIEVANGVFNRVATGSVELKDMGNYSPATIKFSSSSKNFNVTQLILPGEVTLTRQGGSQTRTIYNITAWPSPPYYSIKKGVTVYMGGTIQLADYLTNPGGIYTGNLTFTVVYE